jgi:hypothetical protein
VKGIIEIDQQAQSDGLCKIKAVNNDPVSFRMLTATLNFTIIENKIHSVKEIS